MKHVLLHTDSDHASKRPLEVAYCDSFFCRLAGLMFRRDLKPNEGLLMVQPTQNRVDAAIHMFFMNFDITVVWLDQNLKVVDVALARKWKPFYMPSQPAKYVLEIHASQLDRFHIGDQVILKPCGN